MKGLETQNIEGLKLHRMVVNEEIVEDLGYKGYFDMAFSEFPKENRYTLTTASFAISAYLRSVMANKSPFQQWLKGDYAAMTENQKKGAMVFFGKARCYHCHDGPALNNPDKFYAIGVNDLADIGGLNTSIDDPRNLGRGGWTELEEDMYKFKVPQLYNLKNAGFYFHGSSKTSLRDVVEYFDRGVKENERVPDTQMAPYIRPLNLTIAEKEQLTDFLENALFDPDFDRYVPKQMPSGNCSPNADPISKKDMGCD